ncbi:MAG: hypothetical protein CVT61_11680 [Actinobacteria bacterium HGW-Actinobacteria-11]|uniref:hypothetical protein n=1 Tax=unclassified Microbacterium TaxID=2609290 RepID=UPI000CC60E3C|nr:hypothetical protein [Microbacterium sp. 3H14]PKQ34332.1 MAG: hypothetical protein CVT61_11680 [Actinobacteria bacterium HGW-Actinobacteria-11]TFB16080.1 hypothetical protein E3V93_05335 [Microbacterium sp. 3H14]
MRRLLAPVALLGALLLSGCSLLGDPARDPEVRFEETIAAVDLSVRESVDVETADYLADEGILEMVAAELIALCDDEEMAGMSIVLFTNYGMDEALLAGWEAACPGRDFPG